MTFLHINSNCKQHAYLLTKHSFRNYISTDINSNIIGTSEMQINASTTDEAQNFSGIPKQENRQKKRKEKNGELFNNLTHITYRMVKI